ncbi:DNA translocase FtsK [Lachnospiraceae bacterium]|jgi:S-DNA-T family DNA segregation ATPase FtsK/SpoIIIE|nr:DNA translocase FtsK [uncultured Schaedlerella sp.]MCI9153668.1 DNA translocase FtsK [Ruminococcus sp.]NBI56740.1 DNA translocase FtsK [Lachnospiraceae bacterium]
MAAKSTKRKKTTNERAKKAQGSPALQEEIIILSVLAVCILMLISNFGLGGLAGEVCSAVLFGIFGWMAYLIPVLLFGAAAFLVSNRGNAHAYIKAAALLALLAVLCALLELIMNPYTPGTGLLAYYKQASIDKNSGGLLGGCLVTLLCPIIGVVGSYVVLIVLAIICVILITERSLLKPLGSSSRKMYEGARQRHETSVIRREERMQEKRQRRQEEGKRPSSSRRRQKISGVSFATTLSEGRKSPEVHELTVDGTSLEPAVSLDLEEDTPDAAPRVKSQEAALQPPVEEFVINRAQPEPEEQDEWEEAAKEPESIPADDRPAKQEAVRPAAEKSSPKKNEKDSTSDVETEAAAVEESIRIQQEAPPKEYRIPPMDLLKKGKKTGGDSDTQLRATARKLETTLQNFGVKVHVTNASCGPSVTRYELQPEQGVKVSKIVGLADDIKLNLAVTDLRIEAPIPGKAAVGIEVPNSETTAVMLRDLLEASEFQQSKSRITVAVGKDIAGKTVVADIAKMPHLLVAGSTGSGKSVCINTMIMSMIYKADPEDVKLIMVDPKVVELSIYNGIPHLMIPVVTDPKKAAGALNWAVAEMMKRYDLFAKYNVRDLKGFNEKVEHLEEEDVPKKMPQIVIIVDELADLMMVAPKDVEGAICRLAQLARAAGIHLILATQRPSVNVITGLIKANMPSRIAFAVSSGVDSRTIIDMSGAEKLLGKGDMLFYPTGVPKPMRVQGSFVSDKEVQKVVDYLIENHGNADYSNELEEHMNADIGGEAVSISDGEGEGAGARDQYFAEAGKLIIDKDKASIGMLQRMFKIGFNRAARIMDQLSDAGVVGPEEGTKPRKVLMTAEEFEELL